MGRPDDFYRGPLNSVPWGGNFRKIGGSRIVGYEVFRNRLIVFFIAFVLFLIGFIHLF